MATILYFDPFNGISGDMTLGALVDLGLPMEHLKSELGKLEIDGFELKAEKIDRQGLNGVNFHVLVHERHHHEHGHHHHEHHQHPTPDTRHPTPDSRGFTQIRELIQKSELDSWVKEKAVTIFRRLGEAEAKVHGSSLEEVHFHEVGAVDAIVDIVGACIGFKYFGIARFYTSPLHLGGGTVTFSHGSWPVPTPATAELIHDCASVIGPVSFELTTPTGAAIVTTLAEKGSPPPSRFQKWGFGAGDKEIPEIPNMLRLGLGQSLESAGLGEAIATIGPGESAGIQEEEVLLLEANIDDMDGEMFGHFLEMALKSGVLDAYLTPVQMKKNRPGVLLSVLCKAPDRERLLEMILRETTTLGIRWSPWKRWVLDREIKEVKTELGSVRMKIARLRGQVVNIAPEFDDLKAIAQDRGISLKRVRQRVMEDLKSFDL
ncbi:MAG: nickel pincer cofactor biosynthesis protein LarC [Acidobacteriota bacterium]